MTAENFKQQFLPYTDKLYILACRLLNDRDEACDAVQDVFLKLWSKRNELEIQNNEAFCVTLLKNICVDMLRKRRKNQSLTDVEQVESEKKLSKQIEAHYDWLKMRELIKQLPEQQQQVVKLRHIKEYTMAEIAEHTGLSESNVRTTLSRARKLLREKFEKISDYEYKRN
jgi:RNA polymerase sigma-70 factor (ECF subfamily)